MSDRNDQETIRQTRRHDLITAGIDVYPARCQPTGTIVSIRDDWHVDRQQTIVGRVRAMRIQGGSAFIDLDDGTAKLQLFLQKKQLGDDFQMFTKQLDLGDFLQASGTTFVTKAGEPSLQVSSLTWLAKALRPLPSSWHGLEDVELRYRHRELDLLSDPHVQTVFQQRAAIVAALRQTLRAAEFMEVETPILQPIAGGATAQPFVTHHQALDIDLFLRIAPELYLKRLIVGGFNRVFEFARCFRNEGMDHDHNPEFTQVELYAAYADYHWMMDFTEKLIIAAAQAVHDNAAYFHDGQPQKMTVPFPRIKYRDAIQQYASVDIDDASAVAAYVTKHSLTEQKNIGLGKMIDEIFKFAVRPKLISPTFVYDYPLELSPLAKKTRDNPNYTERFQLLMGGTEIGNAFSELNDPVDQRERFQAQEKLRATGDKEAQRIDEDFLQALEYGMPPTSGLGIGIERLTMALTGEKSIKDAILFPTLRPKS